MAIKIISVKCPECGASLNFKEGRTKAFCSYCGTQILLHNENEFTYRYIDEAELKKASAQEKIELKKLEVMESARVEEGKVKKERQRTGIILVVAGIIAMYVCYASSGFLHELRSAGLLIAVIGGIILATASDKKEEEKKVVDPNNPLYPLPKQIMGMSIFTSYKAFADVYRSAGFNNITCIPLGDLKHLIDKPKENRIGNITLDGKSFVTYGKEAPKDVHIVITYHSF